MRAHKFKVFHELGMLLVALLAWSSPSSAQSWTKVNTPFPGVAGTALLLTDGKVMVQDSDTGTWFLLVPSNGDYRTGSWVGTASMPSGYGPLYYASAILPDDRMLVEGGEYNFGHQDETNLGAIYTEKTNTWQSVTPPSGWSQIGDAPGVVLPNGQFMMASCCTTEAALLDATTLTWTSTGTGKADSYSEEGWTLLPNGKVLTVDVWNGTESELYDPATGEWSLAGSTVVPLVNTQCSEIGPAVLRPDGSVFAIGGNGNTAFYSASGKWSAGPKFPKNAKGQQLGVDDGPAALMPNGHVLVEVAPILPCYAKGAQFFDLDSNGLHSLPSPANAANEPSYYGRFLLLPSGHVLYTHYSSDVEIFTPSSGGNSSWAPHITSISSTITRGDVYTIKGTQFNGLSQGAMYGDDAQMATNFPLVLITNTATGHEYFARTNAFSTMGVATGSNIVSAHFRAPSMETGPATLVVITNGIASQAVKVTVH
jgi:hypothetical protein